MLGQGGTGVATYARALHVAQRTLDPASLTLEDDSTLGRPDPRFLRARRWGRAAWPGGVKARSVGATFEARDIYRLAQVRFDILGSLLEVAVPGPPGIMHWSYPVPIALSGWINVYTVHDAIPLEAPDLTPIPARRHRHLLHAIARRADRLVTVSGAAAEAIAAVLSLPSGDIVNCGQSVDATPIADDVAREPYLLVCGSVEPRKNIVRLLDAYRTSGVTLPLVIAGPDGWRADEIDRAIAATPGVVRIPYLSRPELAARIAGAHALLMPSLAEGFGLPVIEAMALGTPVVTSDGGALAETAGEAALLVDPLESASIAAAIGRICRDEPLRAHLIAAGRRNAERFTPARFAERLDMLYGGLVAHAGSGANRFRAQAG